MNRELNQHGSLRIRRRVRGPALWEWRYRITEQDGNRRLKSIIVGTTEEYPTKKAIRAKLPGLVQAINVNAPRSDNQTVSVLIDRFIADEHLEEIKAGKPGFPLHYSTACCYLLVLNKYLRPRWGSLALPAVRPLAVQEWLNGLSAAPKYRANIRGLLHRLFEKAMLWDLIELQRNPIGLVEIKGASRRRKLPTVLTAEEFLAVLERLPDPQRTMVLVAQCTGLRVSEILGLQWSDFDFERLSVQVSRAVVKGRVDRVKTEYSEDLLPLDPGLARALTAWRVHAPPTAEGWVFANPVTLKPYFACSIGKRYLRRIGAELGIRLGWHTFRHSYRSWLDATGAPIGVQQKLMRHAQVSTTMNIYGNALMQSKRDANSKVVGMALGSPAAPASDPHSPSGLAPIPQ